MGTLARIFTGLGIFCLSLNPVHAQKYRPVINGPAQLVAEINEALAKINSNARVGVAIKSMRYGDVLYARNSKSLFVPASTLKVLTAVAGLLYLGPDFKFPTRFVTDATSIRNGVLNGNLYLVHSGDPSFTYYDLAELLAGLRGHQITQINGNVYIDNSAYDNATTGPGWLWKDKKYCYGAPISASIINHNCLSFRVRPPTTGYFRISDPRIYYSNNYSHIVTKKQEKTCYVKMEGMLGGGLTINNCLDGIGTYSSGSNSVISNVVQYNKALLQELLARFNIKVKGNISKGNASPGHLELVRHESKPLRELVSDMLKMSDNIIAGSLFKKIGELYSHRPGSWENGGNAVGKILARHAAIDIWRMSLIDGSGLSRYNQVTPSQLLRVLDFAFHRKTTNYDFMSALPIAGVDGTLKRRMRNIPWRVRAKTGTMKGVVSLAGYAMTAEKEPIAFVIMINGQNGSVWQYRQFEDTVMNLLTHYKR